MRSRLQNKSIIGDWLCDDLKESPQTGLQSVFGSANTIILRPMSSKVRRSDRASCTCSYSGKAEPHLRPLLRVTASTPCHATSGSPFADDPAGQPNVDAVLPAHSLESDGPSSSIWIRRGCIQAQCIVFWETSHCIIQAVRLPDSWRKIRSAQRRSE